LSTATLRLTTLLALLATATAPAQDPASAVKAVEFDAPSIGRKMKYNIILPEKYEASDACHPVLYLLHGYSANYTHWARMGVPEYARRHDLIVVMPDAGNSWYANWAETEGDAGNAWEDYMVKDLIGHVDATWRTVAAREGRAINGLSMGGYGALMLGLKHPDLFCSIGSHSGAVAFARTAAERLRSSPDGDQAKAKTPRKLSDQPDAAIGIEGFSSQVERSPKGKLFATAEQADACDPFKLAPAIPKDKVPHIYIDCGTEDRLLKGSQDLAKVLMDNKIPFTYSESAGGHDARYWAREVGQSMEVQDLILRRASARVKADAEAKTDAKAEGR